MKIIGKNLKKQEDDKAVNIYCGEGVKIETKFEQINPVLYGFGFTYGVLMAISVFIAIIKLIDYIKSLL